MDGPETCACSCATRRMLARAIFVVNKLQAPSDGSCSVAFHLLAPHMASAFRARIEVSERDVPASLPHGGSRWCGGGRVFDAPRLGFSGLGAAFVRLLGGRAGDDLRAQLVVGREAAMVPT